MTKRYLAKAALALIVLTTLSLYVVGRLVSPFRRKTVNPYRVVMIGTFYNDGWLVAHATPLVHCSMIDEVYVVCDEPLSLNLSGLIYTCPSERSRRIWGRNLARLFTLIRLSARYRPQVYMGYHIMPNGPMARLMASLFGGKAIYQMTGGPIQVIDGGPGSENPLLAATETPSSIMEHLMFSLVRSFDAVIVRGGSAAAFVKEKRLSEQVWIITGAVDTKVFSPGTNSEKNIDVLYVARLIPGKGHKRLLAVLRHIVPDYPQLRAVLAGDGPMMAELTSDIRETGLASNVELIGRSTEIPDLLARSRCYMLLSDTEGMSIALLEAMGSGTAVLVTDVGDLQDAVEHAETGILVPLDEKATVIAEQLLKILKNDKTREKLGTNARRLIQAEYSVTSIAQKWETILRNNSSD